MDESKNIRFLERGRLSRLPFDRVCHIAFWFIDRFTYSVRIMTTIIDVAAAEKILAYRNLWPSWDQQSRNLGKHPSRSIYHGAQFPCFEAQFWSFLRILRIILWKASFPRYKSSLRKNVAENAGRRNESGFSFILAGWIELPARMFRFETSLSRNTRAPTRVPGRNYFARSQAKSGWKSWNGPCQACRYVIRAVCVSLSKRDRTSFPSRSGTIYESVNLSPGGFSWRTGNEPCDRMWEEKEEKKKEIPGKAPGLVSQRDATIRASSAAYTNQPL